MVWIDNYAIPRQYFDDVVKARKMAIEWLENNTKGMTTGQVNFYQKKNSKDYKAYVLMENYGNGRHYTWHYYSRQYGMVSVPLYKNGKIKRG